MVIAWVRREAHTCWWGRVVESPLERRKVICEV